MQYHTEQTQLGPDYYKSLGTRISEVVSPAQIVGILEAEKFPLKIGTASVLNAAESLLGKSGNPPLTMPFTIDNKPFSLIYNFFPGNKPWEKYKVTLAVKSETPAELSALPEENGNYGQHFLPGEVAVRQWAVGPSLFHPGEGIVEISDVVASRGQYEGQGLALGLGLLSNIFLKDFLSRGFFSEDKIAHVTMGDTATRTGFSANLALMLGMKKAPAIKEEEQVYEREFPL